MGSTQSHWVQLPPPKTWKGKYLKLRQLIYAQRDELKDSETEAYRRANEVLYSQCRLIETIEREDK